MQRQTATRVLYILVSILVLTGVVVVVLRATSLAQTMLGAALPPTDSYDAGFAHRPGLTLLHMAPGLVFVILGPLQFVTSIRTRHLNLHRWCGRIYVTSGLLVGMTALIMGSIIGYAGLTETVAVTFFSVLFLSFLGLAVYHIRRGEIPAHRKWMVRAFALGFAVTTMRPMIGIFLAVTGLPFAEALGISFWLAFSLHLVLAELWINFTRTEPVRVTT